MSGPSEPDPDFAARLKRARDAAGGDDPDGDAQQRGLAGRGFRLGVELVAGLLVGVGLGWLADAQLGTRPWGILVGCLLGFAAGMLNVWRAVKGMGYAVGYGPPPRRPDHPQDER